MRDGDAHAETRRRIEDVLARTIAPLHEQDQLELERLLNALATNVEAASMRRSPPAPRCRPGDSDETEPA